MAQKTFINYKDETKSYELGEKHIGMFKPGRYSGFDQMTTGGGMVIKIGHLGKLPKTNLDKTQTLNFGALLLPSGTVLHEDTDITLTVAVNTGNSNIRYDWVIVEHLYEQILNGTPGIYSIIQGPTDGTEPSLVDASKQILIGKLMIIPEGNEFVDMTYTPELIPFLGDNTLDEFYNSFEPLVAIDISTAIDAIPDAGYGNKGLIALATDTEANTGTDKIKAITPSALKQYIGQFGFVIDDNYVHTDENLTTDRAQKLDGLTAGGEPNVQIDWNSISGMDSILNKPVIVNVMAQGTVVAGDVSGTYVGQSLTVTGDILSADVQGDDTEGSLIQVNFASLGTSNYHPILTIRSLKSWQVDAAIGSPAVLAIQNGSFQIALDEQSSQVQKISIFITIIQLNI